MSPLPLLEYPFKYYHPTYAYVLHVDSIRYPHQILYAPFLSSIRATRPASLILLDFISRIIFGEEYR